uniref:Uncharacterized protein n=1 Tax=Anguilla anguilla TaxID=7936 RepID=A0A0E9QR24_ANGAN
MWGLCLFLHFHINF